MLNTWDDGMTEFENPESPKIDQRYQISKPFRQKRYMLGNQDHASRVNTASGPKQEISSFIFPFIFIYRSELFRNLLKQIKKQEEY